MKEEIDSLLSYLKERLTSPWVWYFLGAYATYNWPIWVYLLRGDGLTATEVREQIALILNESGSFGVPVLIAACLVILSPVLSAIVSAFKHLIDVHSENINKYIKMQTVITRPEAIALHGRNNSLEKQVETLSEESSAKIASLESELANSENAVTIYKNELSNIRKEEQRKDAERSSKERREIHKILYLFEKNPEGRRYVTHLENEYKTKFNSTSARFHGSLGQMWNGQYVEDVSGDDGASLVRLTNKGLMELPNAIEAIDGNAV